MLTSANLKLEILSQWLIEGECKGAKSWCWEVASKRHIEMIMMIGAWESHLHAEYGQWQGLQRFDIQIQRVDIQICHLKYRIYDS